MRVYVVLAWWDTDSDDGRLVLGVWRDREAARAAMKRDIAPIKKLYADMDWKWDEEYSEETEDYVYLAAGIMDAFRATIYCWEIIEQDVQ